MASESPSVDICNAEWQSRSRLEIILKCIAVHISTLVLVGQFGSSLRMPFRAKVWLLARAALFPLWSAISLALSMLAAVGLFLQNLLEGAPSQRGFLVSRAIGMYSTATLEPRNGDQSEVSQKLPQHIPLAEIACFAETEAPRWSTDLSGAHGTVLVRPRGQPNGHWFSRVAATSLSLTYIIQSVATSVLVIRRCNFTHMIPSGLPFEPGELDPGKAITPFEKQAFYLALYGIPIALTYIILQFQNVQWQHIDREIEWNYSADSPSEILRRVLVGLCSGFLVHCAVSNWLGFQTLLASFAIPISRFIDWMIYIFSNYREAVFLLVIIMLAGTRARRQRATVVVCNAVHKMPGIVQKSTIFVGLVCARTLQSFDHARQDPTEFYFARTLRFNNSITPRLQEFVILWYIIWSLVFAFAPFLFIFIIHDSIFKEVKMSPTPVSSSSGCLYKTELRAWMWKDPLADKLWAF